MPAGGGAGQKTGGLHAGKGSGDLEYAAETVLELTPTEGGTAMLYLTVPEKLREFAAQATFAVALCTGHDDGCEKCEPFWELRAR